MGPLVTFKDIYNAVIEKGYNFDQFIEFVKDVPEKRCFFTKEILIAIKEAKEKKNALNLGDLLMILNYDGVNKSCTPILCDLLAEDWHYSTDDILLLLYDIKDPSCVDIVYQTSFNIPDWDDARSVAKKCIAVLGQVHTNEAKEKLKLLANSDDPLIKEEALFELKNWN